MTTAQQTRGHDPALHDGAAAAGTDLLTERFRRSFGRPPTATDLVRFQRARTGLELRLPAQVRRAAARLVATL
jgi:hypothetical protein